MKKFRIGDRVEVNGFSYVCSQGERGTVVKFSENYHLVLVIIDNDLSGEYTFFETSLNLINEELATINWQKCGF